MVDKGVVGATGVVGANVVYLVFRVFRSLPIMFSHTSWSKDAMAPKTPKAMKIASLFGPATSCTHEGLSPVSLHVPRIPEGLAPWRSMEVAISCPASVVGPVFWVTVTYRDVTGEKDNGPSERRPWLAVSSSSSSSSKSYL